MSKREKKRTVEQQRRDKLYCAQLLLQSYTLAEITSMVNSFNRERKIPEISQSQVYKDIRSVLAQWQEEQRTYVNQWMEMELQKLQKIENVAWKAFEKSQRGTRPGDNRFIDTVLKCMQQRAKLLGLDAPTKVELNEKAETTNEKPKYDLAAIPDKLLFQVADALQQQEYTHELEIRSKVVIKHGEESKENQGKKAD